MAKEKRNAKEDVYRCASTQGDGTTGCGIPFKIIFWKEEFDVTSSANNTRFGRSDSGRYGTVQTYPATRKCLPLLTPISRALQRQSWRRQSEAEQAVRDEGECCDRRQHLRPPILVVLMY